MRVQSLLTAAHVAYVETHDSGEAGSLGFSHEACALKAQRAELQAATGMCPNSIIPAQGAGAGPEVQEKLRAWGARVAWRELT